jgi:hypothetical protein
VDTVFYTIAAILALVTIVFAVHMLLGWIRRGDNNKLE